MKNLLPSLAVAGLLGGLMVSTLVQPGTSVADAPAAGAATSTATAGLDRDAQVAALLALPSAERRAKLKAMAPADRRGLWIQLKRAQAEQRGVAPKKRGSGMIPHKLANKRQTSLPQRAIGTIAYDDGVMTNSFGGGAIIGNRFDTHTGDPVLSSGTVSTIQAVVVQGGSFSTSSAGFVLLGPQTGGGGAMAIFSSFTNAVAGTTDTVTFTGIGAGYTGSSFFVLFGDFATGYVPAFGTGSVMTQGHHGVVGYTGGMGPNITGTFDFGGALNGLVRATGNIVPVELMGFEIE